MCLEVFAGVKLRIRKSSSSFGKVDDVVSWLRRVADKVMTDNDGDAMLLVIKIFLKKSSQWLNNFDEKRKLLKMHNKNDFIFSFVNVERKKGLKDGTKRRVCCRRSMIHDAGPYKGFLIMHVTNSKVAMVNPPRIGRCDQKEAISGSEIGADNSPELVAAAAGASF
ncbi:uncharacterized protein HKW66_Vig0071950 [Vigna angularis]|uniref:Uncharacterized protein n=1 Tax=Phaseolus angularis TaxID=3914 RepID=A0A8T0K836_PHAAN|nr:uncharacterized protein HKW66_Vig0071950 [Vigna angularis]